MIWFISMAGIIFMFGAKYYLYKIDDEESEEYSDKKKNEKDKNSKKKKNEKDKNSKKKKKPFLKSKEFIGTIIEVLVIVLGATFAIQFTDYQEKQETRKRIVLLLNLASQQVKTQYALNKNLLDQYDESSVEIGVLKYNATKDCSIAEFILQNDETLLNLSTLTISTLVSATKNAEQVYEKMIVLDDTDENIYIYLSTINTQLHILNQSLEIQIDYLNNLHFWNMRHKQEELEKEYENILFGTLNSNGVNSTITK